MTGNKDSQFNIEIDGGNLFRVNYGDSMAYIRGDGRTALSISTYGYDNNTKGIYVICNASSYGYAIESHGNALIRARHTENVVINGLCVNARHITNSIDTNDDFVIFTNSSSVSVSMPRAEIGKVLYVKKRGRGGVTLTGTFVKPNQNVTQTNYTLSDATVMFIKDPNGHWNIFFCG